MNVSIIDDDDNVLNTFRKATLQAENVVCLSATNSIEEFLRLKVFENQKIYLFLDIYLANSLSIHFIPQIIATFPKIEIIIYLAKGGNSKKLETKLSKKDLELLNLLAEGWSYNKISDKVGITLDGVRGRIRSLYTKLNVSSKVQAINKYRNI